MENKRNLYLSDTLFFVVLFSILLLLCYLVGFVLPRDISVREIPVDAERADPTLPLCDDLGEEYVDRIVFLGESTTYGLWRYGVLPSGSDTKNVWTGATVQNGKVSCSGTLSLSPGIVETKLYYPDTGEALNISEALTRKKPEFLIITLGLNNGASYYTEDSFKQCYRTLLNTVLSSSDETTVILQSLFPVAHTCRITAYTPERLLLCNGWICEIAAEYNLGYLDTFSALCDTNGYLKPEYDNGGDGIHLNREGLEEVLRYIRTHKIKEDI